MNIFIFYMGKTIFYQQAQQVSKKLLSLTWKSEIHIFKLALWGLEHCEAGSTVRLGALWGWEHCEAGIPEHQDKGKNWFLESKDYV